MAGTVMHAADQDDLQRGRAAGGLPERQLVDHDVRVEAVGQAEEAEHEHRTISMQRQGSTGGPSTRSRVEQHAQPASASTPVISGIGSSAMNSGMLNQRSRTVALTQGVATEISPMPSTTGAQASRPRARARALQLALGLHDQPAAPSST